MNVYSRLFNAALTIYQYVVNIVMINRIHVL